VKAEDKKMEIKQKDMKKIACKKMYKKLETGMC
jgi:hypothetical protein